MIVWSWAARGMGQTLCFILYYIGNVFSQTRNHIIILEVLITVLLPRGIGLSTSKLYYIDQPFSQSRSDPRQVFFCFKVILHLDKLSADVVKSAWFVINASDGNIMGPLEYGGYVAVIVFLIGV